MILLTLLYLSFGFSFALPTPSDLPTDIPPSLLARSPNTFGTRSMWNIIWSCFSTIFACTWIAVHPNIPAPKDSPWAVLRRRLAIMVYVLVAPEMVILWAARQHYVARYFANRHQRRGWTMTHGFFLVMGGFTLHDERGTALRILEPMELESLSEAGRIEWPSITEEEIQDRSKGDYLSKGIVLVQTSWFIAQCIVRGVYKLEVTELEVATLAFAALNGVTYYLWWHKPLDVRCSIPVYLLKDDKKEGMHSQSITSVSLAGNSVPFSPPISCGPSENLKANHIDPQSPIIEESQIPQQPLVVIRDPEPTLQEPSHHNATTAQESKFTRLSAFIQRKRQKHGIVLGLAYVFLLYPFFAFFGAFSDMIISDTLHDSVPLRVPTFYSSKFSDDDNPIRSSLPVTISVAVIFGGIHCVAWSFHFPTLQEQLAWRISAASVAGLPILIIVFAMFCGYFEERIQDWTILGKIFAAVELPMAIALIVLYVIARIVLLVLPCIGLRALHHTAFVEIQWAAFFPHIG